MRLIAIPLSVMLATASACMLGPVDDKTVTSKRSNIDFNGFHLNRGSPVYIQALNFQTGRFETVREVRAGSTSTRTLIPTAMYNWNASLQLSNRYWDDGYRGARAKVRTLWSTSNDNGGPLTEDAGAMLSVERNWFSCYTANPTVAGFRYNCASDQSPTADIYTRDYCARGPRLSITGFRASTSPYTGAYDFEIWVSGTASVSSIFVGDMSISCRPAGAQGKFKCPTTFSRGPFARCELDDWMETDGRVVARGYANNGACSGVASGVSRITDDGVAGCRARPSSPPIPMDNRVVCKSAPTPSGWIMYDDVWDPTQCGEPTAITYNMKRITRYDRARRGITKEVCASEGLPSGWASTSTRWDGTRCGHPTSLRNRNIRVITKL